MSKTYHFKARDGEGRRIEGEVEADSQDHARWLLNKEYPNLRDILSVKEKVENQKVRDVLLTPGQVSVFYRRLAVMLGAGMNIERALKFLVESSDGPLAEALDLVHQDIVSGRSLQFSMNRSELARLFSPLARGLIRTGLETGSLARALSKLAEMTERREAQRQAFFSAMTYPAILSLCIASVALLFILFIAPGDSGLFAMLGEDLPLPSLILVEISEMLRNPALWFSAIALFVIGGPILRRQWKSEGRLRAWLDHQILDVPVLGSVLLKSTASQVLYVWSSAVRVGLPLTSALALSLEMIQNLNLRSRFQAALVQFREGGELAEALSSQGLFTPLVVSMVAVSVETGEFDTIMAQVSQLYEEEVDTALSQLSSVLEPLLLMIAGVVAGFVALACLMPMLRMTSQL